MGERVSLVPNRLLRSRRITKAKISGEMIEKELAGAKSDLATAARSLRDADHKWATVQAYYSIFHAARALLFARGYREKSHRGLQAMLQDLYSREIPQQMFDDFRDAETKTPDQEGPLRYQCRMGVCRSFECGTSSLQVEASPSQG